MPAEFTLATASKSAMANTMLGLIDGGLAAGSIELQDAADTMLISVTLEYPCGTVDVNGKLNFAPTADAAAVATGTIAKAVFKDSAGVVVFTSNVSLKAGDAFVRLDSLAVTEVGQLVRLSVGEMTY